MNLISHGPYQPWSLSAATSPGPRGAHAAGTGVCPAPLLFPPHRLWHMDKVTPAQMCQHKPPSDLCVTVWTQSE